MNKNIIDLYKFILHYKRKVSQMGNMIIIISNCYNNSGNCYKFMDRYVLLK